MVTRPVDQAQNLCRLIEELGGRAIRFPVVEIHFTAKEPGSRQQLDTLARQLDSYQMAIFISSNAVRGAQAWLHQAMPTQIKLAAVGKATAEAIKRCWPREVICPRQQFDSEGLLALPQLQHIEQQKIIIFRGQGGREKLATELENRGASVTYAEVYHRTVPQTPLTSVQKRAIDAIIVTSNEGLRNLYDIAGAGDRPWLLARQLIVISQRTAGLARQLGFRHEAVIAPSASDQGLLAAVLSWAHNDQKRLD